MSSIPTWDKITSAVASTTSEFGGNWANLISDYFNGVNIVLLDASKAPVIGTLTRFKPEKFGFYDADESHYLVLSVDDIDTGPVRKVKFRRMNNPFEEDYAVLEGLTQAIINKTIDADLNTITNIENADIKTGAAIAWTKLNKTGSILDDIEDVVITTPAQYNIVMRNGSSQWINLAKGSNSTALTVDASGVLAYTTITNAMLAGSITYSKLTLSNSVVNADIATGAAILTTKLADSANFLLKTLDNSFGAHYFDMTRMTAPSNPAANDGRVYTKQIDANNDGIFCKIKKAGGFVEVQIA